jgi:SAM-dependent methyltransferase
MEKWDSRAATREDVLACYHFLLGRPPENEAVVARHLAGGRSVAQLRRRFMTSREFLARNPDAADLRGLAIDLPPIPVEVQAAPEILGRMLARTGAYWQAIGRAAPHWSVLTQDRFRPDSIADSIDAFYASGSRDAELVEAALARHGLSAAALPTCLDFGCGVGRATLALAPLFRRVIGCDISPAHLALAAERAALVGQGNVAWQVATVQAPMPDPAAMRGWDLWYSRIVLQHNPPPIIAYLLAWAFAGLRPGGVAIFQVPTYRRGYSFAAETYLAETAPPDMEMHLLPQAAIFALARQAGLDVLEVREDTQFVSQRSDIWLSNLFVLRRPAA